jgi:hypothetical protein
VSTGAFHSRLLLFLLREHSLLLARDVKQESLSGRFSVEASLVHPGVRTDLVEGWSLSRVVGEETHDEVLELRGEFFTVDLSEVGVELTLDEQVVEVLFGACFFERENSVNQNEEDHSKGEQIYLGTFVLFALFYFWRHICHCTSVALEAIDVLVACEAKVCNFYVQLVVNKDVLKF